MSDQKTKAVELMILIAEAKNFDRDETLKEYSEMTGSTNKPYLMNLYRKAVRSANADAATEALKIQTLALALKLAQKAVVQYEKYGKNMKDSLDAIKLLKEMVLPTQAIPETSGKGMPALPSATVLDQRSLTAFVAAIPELFPSDKPQAKPADTGTVPEVVEVLPEVHEPGV